MVVLCDATDETSATYMLCRDNKTGGFLSTVSSCRHFKDTWRSQEEAEPGVSPVQLSIFCMISSKAHRGHRPSLAIPLNRDPSCFNFNSAG
jgi:hypothetical protein